MMIARDCSIEEFHGAGHVMLGSSPVNANSSLVLTFGGIANEQVSLYMSDAADWRFAPQWHGTLLVNASPEHATSIDMGTVPANGRLTVPIPIGDPGAPSKVLHLQPLFTDPAGRTTLGTARCIVVLQ